MHKMETDTDSNLSAVFQESDDSGVKIERKLWGAPSLEPRDTDTIINQLKLKPTTHNTCLYTGYYKGNILVVVRQRDNIEAPIDDMHEETDSTKRESPNDSDSTRARLVWGRLVQSVSVPTFAAETIHEPEGSTL
jgi:hypothetical protein